MLRTDTLDLIKAGWQMLVADEPQWSKIRAWNPIMEMLFKSLEEQGEAMLPMIYCAECKKSILLGDDDTAVATPDGSFYHKSCYKQQP